MNTLSTADGGGLETLSLLQTPRRRLHAMLAAGDPVAPEVLAGRRYRGISLGLPAWVEALTWKTFAKSFVAEDGRVRGWNERLEQTGLEGPLKSRLRGGEPVTFGHFEVVRGESGSALLDYGRGGNSPWDPVRFVRDPLVCLRPGDPSRLLGWTWLQLGRRRLGTPSWFLLEDAGAVEHVPPVPHPA